MQFLELLKKVEKSKIRYSKKKMPNKKKGGFRYYRTQEQIRDYMRVPAEKKLRWLEDMWRFNREVARSNPKIAEIQEKFRQGKI